MAEFLVKAVNAVHPDGSRDTGSYKRGDIVAAVPDGWPWGKEEHPATANPRLFWIVKIPGLDPESDRVLKVLETDDDLDGSLLRRRLWGLTADDVPDTIKAQLQSTGVVTVTVTQIRNFIKNKRTGGLF